jgi:hypothetical protein
VEVEQNLIKILNKLAALENLGIVDDSDDDYGNMYVNLIANVL